MADQTPYDPSQDQDFRAASMQDKIAFLSSKDPEFARAAPKDQADYVQHLLGNDTLAPAPPNPHTLTSPTNPNMDAFVAKHPTVGPVLQHLDRIGGAFLGVPGAVANSVMHPIDTANGVIDSLKAWGDPNTLKGAPSVVGEALDQGIGNVAGGEAIGALGSGAKSIAKSKLIDVSGKPKPLARLALGSDRASALGELANPDYARANEINQAKTLQDRFLAKEAKTQAATDKAAAKNASPPDPFSGATSSNNPPAGAPPAMPATSATSSTSPQTMPRIPGISAQAGEGPNAPPLMGERGTLKAPDPNVVLHLPEPNAAPPNHVNLMNSIPREQVFSAADRGVPGAADQIRDMAQPTLIIPKGAGEGFPGPRPTLPPPTLPAIPSEGAPPPAPTGIQGANLPPAGTAVAPAFRRLTLRLPPQQ